MKKGQVSIEYLVVLGFLMVLLVPLLVLFNQTQKDTQDRLVEAQSRRVADLIRDAAERVYYAGEPAQETLQLYFPERINTISFTNNSLTIQIHAGPRLVDVYVPSIAPLSGSLRTNPGVHNVRVRAVGTEVQVTET